MFTCVYLQLLLSLSGAAFVEESFQKNRILPIRNYFTSEEHQLGNLRVILQVVILLALEMRNHFHSFLNHISFVVWRSNMAVIPL